MDIFANELVPTKEEIAKYATPQTMRDLADDDVMIACMYTTAVERFKTDPAWQSVAFAIERVCKMHFANGLEYALGLGRVLENDLFINYAVIQACRWLFDDGGYWSKQLDAMGVRGEALWTLWSSVHDELTAHAETLAPAHNYRDWTQVARRVENPYYDETDVLGIMSAILSDLVAGSNAHLN
jgi:hypothetical protein